MRARAVRDFQPLCALLAAQSLPSTWGPIVSFRVGRNGRRSLAGWGNPSMSMNRYERRRRLAPVLWLMAFLMALPPGWMTSAGATSNLRLSSFTRDAKLETFRNPQFSGSNGSRFLGNNAPQALIGSGGDTF